MFHFPKHSSLIMSILLLLLAYFLPSLFIRKIAEERETDRRQNETEQTTESQREFRGVIVVDCGHGGRDSGTIGAGGAIEKDLNLLYGKKLRTFLEEEGYQVVMTRETDQGLYDEDAADKKAQDMQRRCDRIKEAAPLLTVSIHQNSYPDPAVRGPQVFYYETSQEGQKLAASIQKELNDALTETNSREIKANDSYYLLKQSQGPAVIVECGFLSSPQDEALLVREEYQDRAAEAICRGIVEYLSGKAETIRESG